MSKKPTEKFSFGGSFNVGGIPAGEDSNAIKVESPAKAAWQPRGKKNAAPEEDDEEEEEEDDEDDEDNEFANLPQVVINRITAVRNMHNDYEAIEEAYKAERIALEQKYLDLKQVVIEKRRQIVAGEFEPPVEASETAGEKGDAEEEHSDVKGIPGFWLTILTSHPSIGELVTEEDIPALEHLTDVTVEYGARFEEFTLTFHFKENEFFSNATLKKRYEVSPDLLDEKAPALSGVDGSVIEWKAGKNLTVAETVKKQKAKNGKNKGQVKTVVTTAPKPSFFHYFGEPLTEEEEAEEAENEDEDTPRIRLSQEEDYDIGHSIRTSLIPEAVLWYTGEAIEDDDEDDEDDEGLFEDADDDEDEEEDEEEDSDEDERPRGKGKGGNKNKKGGNSQLNFTPEGGFAAAGGAPGEKAECKQN
mmetsp:Transcript_39292/g.68044  ORF Transcript_39292/g.68044 Transcript_39292/m.68044 type:complete len:417 (-) Transcript_39292:112-1362(-)